MQPSMSRHGSSPGHGTTIAVAATALWRRLAQAVELQRHGWPLWLPVCFGIGVGSYFALPLEPSGWLPLAAAVAALVPALTGRWWRGGVLATLFALLAVAGFGVAQWRSAAVAAPVLAKRTGPVEVSGQVLRVEARGRDARLLLRSVRLPGMPAETTPARVRVVVRPQPDDIRPGDWVAVRAVLMPPARPSRPGGFDFARMAWFQRLGAVGFAVGRPAVMAPPDVAGDATLAMRVNGLRQRLTARIRAAVPGPTGAVAAALITGERGAIAEADAQAMRASGLAHLLAISGLHIGLVAGTLFFAVRFVLALVEPVALRYPIKKWAAVAALLGAFGYLLLSGATVPTQRAFLMAALALGAVLIDRNPISMRLVAFAAMVVLLAQPESLLGPSFQMSFAAVIGLVAVYELVGARFARGRRRRGPGGRLAVYVGAVLLTTLVASAATSPFAAYHFHRIASYGLLANLLAVPLMGVWIMPCAVLALLLMPFGLEAMPLWAMGQAIDLVLAWAHAIADLPGAIRRWPAMPVAGLVLLAGGGLWLCLWRGWGRLAGLLPVATGLVLALAAPQPDLIVKEDGRFAAVRIDDAVYLAGRRHRRTLEDWLDAWALPPEAVRPVGDATPLRCDALGCLVDLAGHRIALARDARALGDDCRLADLLISAVPVRYGCRGAGIVVIDRFDLWRRGGHAWQVDGGSLRMTTVAGAQGQRPWAAARGRDREGAVGRSQ